MRSAYCERRGGAVPRLQSTTKTALPCPPAGRRVRSACTGSADRPAAGASPAAPFWPREVQKPMNHGYALADWSTQLAGAGVAAATADAAGAPSCSHTAGGSPAAASRSTAPCLRDPLVHMRPVCCRGAHQVAGASSLPAAVHPSPSARMHTPSILPPAANPRPSIHCRNAWPPQVHPDLLCPLQRRHARR